MSDAAGVLLRLRRANEALRRVLDRLDELDALPCADIGADGTGGERKTLLERARQLASEVERLIERSR